MTTDVAATDLLTSLMERKCRCLEQLLALGQQQGTLVAAGEVTPLLQLLSAKQQLLAALQAVEQQLDPYRLQEPAERQWRGEAARRQCGQLLARAEALFQEILAAERNSEDELRRRRDETGRQLAQAQQATLARQAYVDMTLPPAQLDLTSQS
ncbi:MAG: hypothetical protein JSS27_03890 [Planctomycetes bacterium]|nr:hypothetical protein [Planctomycetota bacterium]